MKAGRHPGKLGYGEDRFDDAVRFLNGRFDVKVSARDTDGAMCIIDTFRDMCGGPPLHYHQLQDEWFMVLEGSFLFQLGNERFQLGPGDSVFGPRMVPHGFRNLTQKARLLLVFQPALRIEEFFRTGLTVRDADGPLFEALHREHSIINVGPPLALDPADG
jgi:mannose-6-phosphate isomerase-like protein (cupin superfamily)